VAKKRPRKESPEKPGFEESLQRLEGIVHLLEEGDLGLTEALARYEEGVRLLRQAYDLLEHAERRIELLSGVDADGNHVVDWGFVAGGVVTADAGANAIVVRAPAGSMPLIAELIRQLDKSPDIDSLVKVFTLQNSDATQLTTALQTLFGDDAGTLGTSVGAGNLAGLPPSTAGSESSLVPLRFSPDIRTNSIIASGSAEDLEVVESILLRLDSEGFAERITEVIWLRHQAAEAVGTAIQDYVTQRTNGVNRIQQFQQGGLGPYDLPDRDLIVASHFETNSLLISVSPRIYEEVRRLIDKLDRRPPMVLIKVLLAEVRLDDAFEIGGEVGLQDSLLYDRGIAAGAFPGATAPSNTGFNFNNNGIQQFDDTGNPLGNSFGQGNLAARGLSSFGLGTSNSDLGYGGFVLSAASDSISLLLRTLQESSRLQILSRPQIMTMDNTEGYVQVGRQIARVTDVINSGGLGQTQIVTEDIEIGLIMQVLPRVGADGLIVRDVDATRSDRDENSGTLVPTGDLFTPFVLIDDIRRTTAQSTIAAYSGQTVVFGGLIQKSRASISRRVPFVADIPLLGYLFKYDSEIEFRTELLVIMTPMLVNGDEDMEYVKQVESSRMSWCLADVVEAHGDVGLSGGYGLWGPAVGGTIYPDLQPTVEYPLAPPKIPYTGGAPITFPSNSQIIPGGIYSVPGEVHDAPGAPIDMIDSGLEPTSVVPAAPNYAPQGELPPPAQQGNVLPRGMSTPQQPRSPGIPNPVVLPELSNGPEMLNRSLGRTGQQAGRIGQDALQPGFNMPNGFVTPVSNSTPLAPTTQPPASAGAGSSAETQMRWPAATTPAFFPQPNTPKRVNWMELTGDAEPNTDASRRQPHRLGSSE
jgi:general secretion pathway protein D